MEELKENGPAKSTASTRQRLGGRVKPNCKKGLECPNLGKGCPWNHVPIIDNFKSNEERLNQLTYALSDTASQKTISQILVEKDLQTDIINNDVIQFLHAQELKKQVSLLQVLNSNDPSKQSSNDDGDFVCEVCYEKFTNENIFFLECHHFYHRECLSEHWKTEINQLKFPLRCFQDGCKLEVSDVDIRSVFKTQPELLQKYQDFTLNWAVMNIKDLVWCPTAGCNFLVSFENPEQQQVAHFKCPKCQGEYCLKCRVEFHKNQSCEEYKRNSTVLEEDKQLEELAKSQNWKRCPFCKAMVGKDKGCDHMKCKCGKEFCYRCGGVYKQCGCPAASLFGLFGQPAPAYFQGSLFGVQNLVPLQPPSLSLPSNNLQVRQPPPPIFPSQLPSNPFSVANQINNQGLQQTSFLGNQYNVLPQQNQNFQTKIQPQNSLFGGFSSQPSQASIFGSSNNSMIYNNNSFLQQSSPGLFLQAPVQNPFQQLTQNIQQQQTSNQLGIFNQANQNNNTIHAPNPFQNFQ